MSPPISTGGDAWLLDVAGPLDISDTLVDFQIVFLDVHFFLFFSFTLGCFFTFIQHHSNRQDRKRALRYAFIGALVLVYQGLDIILCS